MSVVFVSDTKGRWINADHILIIDRNGMATLVTGGTVELHPDWNASSHAIVAVSTS